MRFKLDENMPASLVGLLESLGHDADTVADEGVPGTDDASLIRLAGLSGRILLTFDADFADVRSYPLGSHGGIVVFRLVDQRWPHIKEAMVRLLKSGILGQLAGGIVIADGTRIRWRRGN